METQEQSDVSVIHSAESNPGPLAKVDPQPAKDPAGDVPFDIQPAAKLETKDKLTLLWNEYKDQNDWQRHNEAQRAQLSSILLTVSAALVAFLSKDGTLKPDAWPIPCFLIGIGIFGVFVVLKYWERFMHHTRLERAYRCAIDLHFRNGKNNAIGEEAWRAIEEAVKVEEDQTYKNLSAYDTKLGLFMSTRRVALRAHNSSSTTWLKDPRPMQHWLWIGVFALIGVLGAVLLAKARLVF